ncbi:MAG TPA: type II toxin-antitoxin system VapC family toxin [Burkholderiales bacterium]|nr:type II toxin-antitoxin system VapC family toxin [Burkholderiales bacterium]
MSFVLDSSIALAWVLPDESNPRADELLERLVAEGAVVPPIWPLEIGNVLLVALRRRRIRQEEFETILERLARLPIEVDIEATDHALAGVLLLAAQLGLTTYDAAYLDLAQRRKLPLATLDKRLRAACDTAKLEVV